MALKRRLLLNSIGSRRKTCLRRQVQRRQAEYYGELKGVVCIYLISARRGAVGKSRRWQGEAERLLSCVTSDGIRARTECAVDTSASRRHFGAVLDAYLRPQHQADLDNTENEQKEGRGGQRKF